MAKKKASAKKASKAAQSAKKPTAKKTVKIAKKSAEKKAVGAKATTDKPVKKAVKPVKKAALQKPAAKKSVAPKKLAKPVASVAAKSSTGQAVRPVAKASPKSLLKPLDDRIVIQIRNFEKRTAGGLYIPDSADVSGNYQGTVLAVGQGHKNKKGKVRPMDVKPGDEVLFDQHAGAKVTLDGEEVRILRESEVLGIVEK